MESNTTLVVVLIVLAGIVIGAAVRIIRARNDASESKNNILPVQVADAAGAEFAKLAPGSVGDVMTFDVPDQTAAMIMAVVADKIEAPLNQLRFISIKQVDQK